jgi:PAS domain S-box-containing protein
LVYDRRPQGEKLVRRNDGAELPLEPRSLAQLIAELPVGVFILDRLGNAVYSNALAESLLGRVVESSDAVENLSERYAVYVAGTDRLYPTDELPVVRALRGERTVVDDLEIDHHGERVALEVTATPIFNEDGTLLYAVAVFKDITPRRQAQRALAALNEALEDEVARRTAQLRRTVEVLEKEIRARHLSEQELLRAKGSAESANRSKSVFLMNLSHELRTPLGHIIGFTELLAERVADPALQKLARGAESSGRDLLERIDSLIELARAEAETEVAGATRFDFDGMLQEVADAAGVQCAQSSVGSIQADEETVRRVLAEALQRADLGACLTATAEREGSSRWVVVSVPSVSLRTRLRALGHLFGEHAPPPGAQFRQEEIDIRLAIARAHMRRLGGDITASEGDVVKIVFPAA